MREVFAVIAPGPYTTVQDQGRFGYRRMGVPVSGALDPFAHRVANLLVGNSPGCAVLEATFVGPRFEVLADADIAVTGAVMALAVNGAAVPCWRSVRVRRGDEVRLGRAVRGCRAYIAVTGGVDVPVVMGSRSTYVSGGMGGMAGRPLRAGDVIRRGKGGLLRRARVFPGSTAYPAELRLRAVPGPQDDCFSTGLELFFSTAYAVTPQTDRMGCRLQGPAIPRAEGAPLSIVSEPSLPGNVQVPADGQPIILLVEQTIGGYNKIATVISPDLGKIAQAKPGDRVGFVRVSIEEAHAIFRDWNRYVSEVEAFLTGAG